MSMYGQKIAEQQLILKKEIRSVVKNMKRDIQVTSPIRQFYEYQKEKTDSEMIKNELARIKVKFYGHGRKQ